MKLPIVSIYLSRQEIEYLAGAGFLSRSQLDAIRSVEWLSSASALLRLSRSSAEKFRESFTDRLAQVGFNENYETTPEGQMLEKLIDCFYIA